MMEYVIKIVRMKVTLQSHLITNLVDLTESTHPLTTSSTAMLRSTTGYLIINETHSMSLSIVRIMDNFRF